MAKAKVKRRCRCKALIMNGHYVATDQSRCFKHAPRIAAHNKRRDELICKCERSLNAKRGKG